MLYLSGPQTLPPPTHRGPYNLQTNERIIKMSYFSLQQKRILHFQNLSESFVKKIYTFCLLPTKITSWKLWRKHTRKSGRMHIWHLNIQELLSPEADPGPSQCLLTLLTFPCSMPLENIRKILWATPLDQILDPLLRSDTEQWRIQDFPEEGAPTPRGRQPMILSIFAENCMKMKKFWPPGGGGGSASPAPP